MNAIGPALRPQTEKPLIHLARHGQAFVDQLMALMPAGARLRHLAEKPWHSATFAGQILLVKILLKDENASDQGREGPGPIGRTATAQTAALRRRIIRHSFDLPRHFVAQISTHIGGGGADTLLIEVEALLLSE